MEYLAMLAPLLASAIGEAAAAGDDAKAEALRQQAMAQYNIDLPPVQTIALQSQAATAHNPQAQSSRLDALRQLSSRANEGYNDTDKAAINDTLSDVNQRERGARMAITQGMDPNSGAAVAAQLSNQQANAQRANQQGVAIAGQSRANALKALMAQGQLAGDIEGDEFDRGQAADAISQFNERNRMGAQQDRFDNQMALANAKSGLALGDSDFFLGKGNRKRRQAAGVGTSVQQGILGAQKANS